MAMVALGTTVTQGPIKLYVQCGIIRLLLYVTYNSEGHAAQNIADRSRFNSDLHASWPRRLLISKIRLQNPMSRPALNKKCA